MVSHNKVSEASGALSAAARTQTDAQAASFICNVANACTTVAKSPGFILWAFAETCTLEYSSNELSVSKAFTWLNNREATCSGSRLFEFIKLRETRENILASRLRNCENAWRHTQR